MSDPADLRERFAELGEVDEELVAAAARELDPKDIDSLIYFGIKAEKAFAELADRISSTAHSETVGTATQLLGEMTNVLRHFDPTPTTGGWLKRVLGRTGPSLRQRFKATAVQLDRLAAQLESCSNPLMVEAVTLDRFEDAILRALQRIDAYLQAGLRHLPDFKDAYGFHDLLRRLEDMYTARTVATQNLATLHLMRDNRRRLAERVAFLLDRALPLWRHQAKFAIELMDQLEPGRDYRDAEQEVLPNTGLNESDVSGLRAAYEESGQAEAVLDAVNRRLSDLLEPPEPTP
ncbi:MAG: toxic anion resistance protein [Xanthomonadales bacterium]|nr:toxic anion resistance protein [Xanthomonadales bacterium]